MQNTLGQLQSQNEIMEVVQRVSKASEAAVHLETLISTAELG